MLPTESDRPLPGRQREARMNDAAVLAAAREVFSTRGSGASMADVARHAGVGVGSIYRRYPTKEALVAALHVYAVQEAADRGTEVADEFDVPEALRAPRRDGDADETDAGAVGTFLSRQIRLAGGPLLRPPGIAGPIPAELAAVSDDLHASLDRLVAHDRAAGLLPEGFAAADVMQLLQHLRPSLPYPRERSDALHLRYLALVLRGLREQAAAGVALTDGPQWDEWVGAWHE